MTGSLEVIFTVAQGAGIVEMTSVRTKDCLDNKLAGTPQRRVTQAQLSTGQLPSGQ